MKQSRKKEKYISMYETKMVDVNRQSLLIQTLLPTDELSEIEARSVILQKMIEHKHDMKLTPYFEKRSENIIQSLFLADSPEALIDVVIKSISISQSMHFKYRDFQDILEQKMSSMTFADKQEELLRLVKKSLTLNNVIAPKIGAIWNLMNAEESEEEHN